MILGNLLGMVLYSAGKSLKVPLKLGAAALGQKCKETY